MRFKATLSRTILLFSVLTASAASVPAQENIAVVATIKPIHSLVAAVMAGVGKPALIVKGNSSPHSYSLRPSDASALEAADVVFQVGLRLETFLQEPLSTLSGNATIITLSDNPGINLLKMRKPGMLRNYTSDPSNQEHLHDHHHEIFDPHIWLSPSNAIAMLHDIADVLSKHDHANSSRYEENAAKEHKLLTNLESKISIELSVLEKRPFIVFHDAYQHFEVAFGLNAAGSISINPQIQPEAYRLTRIKRALADFTHACIFIEPQFNPKLVTAITSNINTKIAELDPIGTNLEKGPGLYPAMMRKMASAFTDCLTPSR